jgi:hypothetical protein
MGMNINVEIKDRNGAFLEIGDYVDIYDWGRPYDLIGRAEIYFDTDEGCIALNPQLIEDNYNLVSKALPRSVKVVE